jgi:hypothetical protein
MKSGVERCARGLALAWLAVLTGCGGVSENAQNGSGGSSAAGGAASTGGSMASGGSPNIDCSRVGCAPAYCGQCDAPCGCCDLGCPWVSFKIDEGWGPCPTADGCASQWLVTPDGMVMTNKSGVGSQAQMSASDLSALEAILVSPAFQTGMRQGFSCGPPPTDVGVTFSLNLPSGPVSQEVTSCVFSGTTNPAASAHELVSKY